MRVAGFLSGTDDCDRNRASAIRVYTSAGHSVWSLSLCGTLVTVFGWDLLWNRVASHYVMLGSMLLVCVADSTRGDGRLAVDLASHQSSALRVGPEPTL